MSRMKRSHDSVSYLVLELNSVFSSFCTLAILVVQVIFTVLVLLELTTFAE